MRIATIKLGGTETAGIVTQHGVVPLADVNGQSGSSWKADLFRLIRDGELPRLTDWYNGPGREKLESSGRAIPFDEVIYAPLYRHPGKIFGIGLNYADHAGDLAEKAPTGIPGSFFKPATAIIGHGDEIKIPVQSEKTTAEAELGVIIGRECENIGKENWLEYVAGFTTIIDMTAEDILRLNPRYLTHAKSFETFFSFGPHLVTPDEVPDVTALNVQTVLNGGVQAQNVVSNMTFTPDILVSLHSKVFKWEAGDVLSTGTPRAVHIKHGDVAECRISGFTALANPVTDKKNSA
ncbi:MAG: fumarylacetoacetate hydrolase family protein [Synergistaceae bacterium]|jgi:2-keto-4-pentenoate hydratase/2-oxohepta-3-ene-1,7-dioic acid hydratase in catechol pathway|nr:fumarylacetoacetate hydrolase family protein [Synergistaceae bacterium]